RDFIVKTDNNKEHTIFLAGIGGLVDEETIRKQVVEPLLSEPLEISANVITSIKKRLYVKDVNEEDNLYSCLLKMLKGSTVILIDGEQAAILIKAEASVER